MIAFIKSNRLNVAPTTPFSGALAISLAAVLCLAVVPAAWGQAAARQAQQDPQQPQDPPQQDAAENADGQQAEQEEEVQLPKLEEMQPLSLARLMKGPPEDWVVLIRNDEVVVVQPVRPRPNTLEFIEQRIRNPAKYEPADIGVDEAGRPLGPRALAQKKREWRRTLPYLELHLPFNEKDKTEAADQKYYIEYKKVKQIIYFEDMQLAQIDRFLDAKKISEAYEMIVVLRKRDPKWPGLAFREFRLLFAEAELYLDKGRNEFALVNLEQLHDRNPDYPELSRTMGEVFDEEISSAYENEDFRRARHFLARIKKRYPEHDVARKWTEKFESQAASLMEQAEAAEAGGDIKQAVAHVEQAARVWPSAKGLSRLHSRLANRHQILRVGVLFQPKEGAGPEASTVADLRRTSLIHTRLFEPDNLDGAIVRYRSRFLSQWEPSSLGRRINFQLRPHRQPWESQDVLIAVPLIQQFGAKMDTRSDTYDERFSDRVATVSLRTPFEFNVTFDSVPFRAEPLFTFPLAADGSFKSTGKEENRVTYERAIPEPDDERQFHVAQIDELQYPSYEKAMQGLLRGEVQMLPHLKLSDVAKISEHPSFFVLKYQLPVTHVVQFNPEKKSLRSKALRRALASSLNREQMLTEHVLQNALPEQGRLTSAPYPRSSYAYNERVPPHRYDIELALALTLAAKKDLGSKQLPTLKLRCAPDQASRDVAELLIKNWARVGINVELLPASTSEDGSDEEKDWDLVYRTVTMHEPAVELWPMLTLKPTAELEDLRHLPNWLRDKFVSLDRAANWTRAEQLLHELQESLAAEMLVIPLWEVDDYMIVRKTIRNVPEAPMSTYDKIEQWVVQPWYPRD